MRFPTLALGAVLLCSTAIPAFAQESAPMPTPAAKSAEDPYIWLEEKDSPRALAWVEERNAPTVKLLESDPRYRQLYDEALKIAGASDRIPQPSFLNGRIFNFWQDEQHLRGIWRSTSLESYRSANPQWTTVLDIDALNAAEGKSFVFKGAQCLPPEERLCLVSLSEGGEDATEVREFDLASGKFVEGGFRIPRSTQGIAWEDADTLLVGTDWSGTKDDLTESGYPYIIRRVKRGQPLAQASEVYRGAKADVGAFPAVLRDGEGRTLTLIVRALDFFHNETFVLTSQGVEKLAIPAKAEVSALVGGRAVVKLDEDWSLGGSAFKAGSVVSLDLAALKAAPTALKPKLVWAPGPREALEQITATRGRLLLATLDNVRGRVISFAPVANGNWIAEPMAVPDNLAVSFGSADEQSDAVFINSSGFLTPNTLSLADAASGTQEVLKTLPARFDASNHVVHQREATSSDGTKIPYFVVHRKDLKMDGSTPTLMGAYGGFQVSSTPYYSGITGKLWLERGGAFVIANIRGGGEFGPAWHQVGLGVKRQIIYDDFEAVSRDLIASGITSARRLGIQGGSNGGLLMGVAMVQNPELYRAIAIQIPLLDMIRISKIARGASWQGEYGDVNADPAVRAFWEKTSPYQNLKRGVAYPEPFIFTTTRDDRTGPQHARKFAARMEEYGLPFLYFENTEGGHGSGADIKQSARSTALTMTYFVRKLMD